MIFELNDVNSLYTQSNFGNNDFLEMADKSRTLYTTKIK